MQLYRLCLAAFAKTPLDGEGSFRVGGRWSSPGTRVAYVATSAALAQLEFLGHLLERDEVVSKLALIIVCVPDDVRMESLRRLPADWRSEPAATSTKRIGDRWAHENSSCLLAVPSTHLPRHPSITEHNVLVNPTHAEFGRIQTKRVAFSLDPRLL